jgi:hypothetical protein
MKNSILLQKKKNWPNYLNLITSNALWSPPEWGDSPHSPTGKAYVGVCGEPPPPLGGSFKYGVYTLLPVVAEPANLSG